jgi:replicative DNA helicase
MIKTENKELDSFWNLGMKPGGLIVIAARPGMGKTSFLLSIGERISQKHKTQLISLETSVDRLKQNRISDSILIDDSPENNIELLSEIISQNKPEVVLIDYVQLMSGNRENLIKDLKAIAVKFNICLIVTSQISREPEYRSDRRPIINDLTTSGKLFNSDNIAHIDSLTFFYRDNYYNRDSQKPDTIELIEYDNGNKKVIQLDWLSLHKN